MKSEQTRTLMRARNWLLFAQLALMLGTVCVLLVCMIRVLTPSTFDIEQELGNLGTIISSLGVSLGITVLLLVVVGHKVRNTIWMGCVLLSSYLFGTTGMWIVFAVWALDEYIIYPLYRHEQARVVANREIDRRLADR